MGDSTVITVNNIPDYGHIHSLALYSRCTSPALDSTGLSSDNSTAPLIINAGGLIIGNTYYILMAREEPGCTGCVDTALFGYCLKSYKTPAIVFDPIFSGTDCGLNYTYSSIPMHGRYNSLDTHANCNAGNPDIGKQTPPFNFTIAGIPAGATLVDAYIIFEVINVASNYVPNFNLNSNSITALPLGTVHNATGWESALAPYNTAGCMAGASIFNLYDISESYYQNVNSAMLPGLNGTYSITGLPLYNTGIAPNCTNNYADADGATLIVIYKAPCANYKGTLTISGALHESSISSLGYSLAIPSVCNNVSTQNAFFIESDIQDCSGADTYTIDATSGTFHGPPSPPSVWPAMWNTVPATTTLASGATTCNYTISTGEDEVDMVALGDYYQCPNAECHQNNLAISGPGYVCYGNSATLTASGANTYVCSTGATTSSITVTPILTTTYTVSGTNSNGCTGTASITVHVDPPLHIAATGPLGACVGTPITLCQLTNGGTTPYFYTWQPGGLHTPCISIATPTTTTTYTVTVEDGAGCTATSAITINVNCCNTQGSGIAISGPVNSSSLTNPLDITGAANVSTISGTLTIDNNYTIEGTNIAMGNNAEIVVTKGNTLTITNDGSYISRLYSCGDMWQGIVVQPGAHLVINGNSIIEDAKEAIEGQNDGISLAGSITVTNALLNDNYQDIVIDPYMLAAAYPILLTGSTLTCQGDGSYSSGVLKYPYTNRITYQGVYLNNVQGGGAQIGIPLAGDMNTFSNMNFGVYGLNSDFYVYNNTFEHLNGPTTGILCFRCPPPPAQIGTAIVDYAKNFDYTLPGTHYTAIVGGGIIYEPNYFNTCFRGVDLTNYVTMGIYNNTFWNLNNNVPLLSPAIGDQAVWVKLQYDNMMEIDSNHIVNYYTGIHLFRQAVPLVFIPVDNNINFNSISQVALGTVNTSILAEDATLQNIEAANTTLNIQYNTALWPADEGVELRNIGKNYLDVTNNYVNLLRPVSLTNPSSLHPRSGVQVDGCASAITVAANYINCPGNGYLGNLNVRGVYLRQSTDIYVECNSIYNVGECLSFDNWCFDMNGFTGGVFVNKMYRSYYGWVLEASGTIGPQGFCDPTTLQGESIQDEWIGPFVNSPTHYQTYTFSSVATASPIWVSNAASPYDPTPNGGTAALNYSTLGAINIVNCCIFCGAPACGSSYPSTLPALNLIQPWLDNIVQDSVQFPVFTASTQFMSRQYVYNLLTTYPSLMTGDSILQNFYNAGQPTCMGGLVTVNQQIDSGSITLAQNTNSSLVPACNVEKNQIDVNNIYLSTLAKGIDTLMPTQYNTLYSIAQKCPLEDGLAVFQARALYNRLMNTDTIFENICDTSGNDRIAFNNTTTGNKSLNNNVKVFPNPANTVLNIMLQLTKGETANIYLYNSLGEMVRCQTLSANYSTINTNDLAIGLYYYRIPDSNGNILKADKQMITH